MTHRTKQTTGFAALLLLLLAGGFALIANSTDLVNRWSYAAEAGRAQAAREGLESAADISSAFKAVAKSMRPAVVSISSTKTIRPANNNNNDRRQRPELPEGFEQFERFFGDDFFDRLPQQGSERGLTQRGLGTGVIVSEDGYVLTNNHVVAGADEVRLTLSDNRELLAEIVGTDPKTDLAVLKVNANNLLPAKLGDSGAMEVGEWVLAIGSPFGLDQTVTAGIISATSRSNVGITDYEDFLQTDCAINPGNSGGPLVNLRGEVVGINTAIASRSGGYQGIGFSIPSNMVRHVMESIIQTGGVERGWLGAAIQDLNKDLAASFNYSSTDGVLIGDVVPGSPGAKAGLKSGDIVMEFQGRKMESSNELRNSVAATAPGTSAKLKIFRDGKAETITVEIGKLAGQTLAQSDSKTQAKETDWGVTVETLTPEIAEQLSLDAKLKGVVVTDVDPASVAARLGLRKGDVVVSVAGEEVHTAGEFEQVLKDHNLKEGVRIQVVREGVRSFLFLRIG